MSSSYYAAEAALYVLECEINAWAKIHGAAANPAEPVEVAEKRQQLKDAWRDRLRELNKAPRPRPVD